MRARTLCMSVVTAGIAVIAGCRDSQPGFKTEPSPAGAPSSAQQQPQLTPPGPRVIGVNTSHIDETGKLSGFRIAILATDGFEQAELIEPRQAYANLGAVTVIVSPKTGYLQGYEHEQAMDVVKADLSLEDANPADFDALELPGGVINSDKLRLVPGAVAFVQAFARNGKPIAAICHGLWTMVDAGVVRGRTVTSWPSLKTDLTNAGAKWVDQDVVQDRNFVTSRKPADIPAFNERAIAIFEKELHAASVKPAIGGGPVPE